MKKTYRNTVIVFAALLAGVGCGKEEKSTTEKLLEGQADVDLVADLTGIDENTRVAIEKDENEQPSGPAAEQAAPSAAKDDTYVGGTQGAFIGVMKIGEKEVKGSFNVLKADASAEVVLKNAKSGQEIRLDPGKYDFVFSTPSIVGEPEFTLRDVEIETGRRLKRDVNVPVGKITLVTGAKCARKNIKIRLKGASDWYKGKFSTCQELTLMAGEYDAMMGDGKKGTTISGIQVYDGGVRDVLIRNQ
jgi:hypothetical protein